MSNVTRLPRMFWHKRVSLTGTDDPRLVAVIQVQSAIRQLSEEEQTFVLKTVQDNLDLHRRHSREYQFEE